MNKWQVVDWAGNLQYNGKKFRNFDEAREYITEMAYKHSKYNARFLGVSIDEAVEGYEEDMYAVRLSDEN